MIGTGASAIQFVPEIQPRSATLHLFQRTPSWVMPDPDRPVTELERAPVPPRPGHPAGDARADLPALQEATVLGTIVDRRLLEAASSGSPAATSTARSPTPSCGAKLTPDYTLGCKRITMSNTYYPALTQPNAEVVTDPITEVDRDSIVTADGTERELDTIILGDRLQGLRQPRLRGAPRPRRPLAAARPGRAARAPTSAPRSPASPTSSSSSARTAPAATTRSSSPREAHINYVARVPARDGPRAASRRSRFARGLRGVQPRDRAPPRRQRLERGRLRELVPRRERAQRRLVAGLHGGLWQRTRRFDRGSYLAEPA